MTRADIVKIITAANADAPPDRVRIYVDSLITYLEADENIAANGAMVSHPRTGAPIENPYLKIRTAAGNTMLQLRLDAGGLM